MYSVTFLTTVDCRNDKRKGIRKAPLPKDMEEYFKVRDVTFVKTRSVARENPA